MCDGNHRLTRQIFRHREIEVLEMVLLGLAWVPLGVEWTIVDHRRRSPLVRLVAPGLARVNRYEDRHLLERAEGLLQNWVSLGMDRQGDSVDTYVLLELDSKAVADFDRLTCGRGLDVKTLCEVTGGKRGKNQNSLHADRRRDEDPLVSTTQERK